MAAGEVSDPAGCLPRALAWGMIAGVTRLWFSQRALFYALPFSEILV